MRFSDVQVKAGILYIKRWLINEGYSANKWSGELQDGHWLLYAMTEADGANCVCCQEPNLQNAPKFLQLYCCWKQIHLEALDFVIERAAIE